VLNSVLFCIVVALFLPVLLASLYSVIPGSAVVTNFVFLDQFFRSGTDLVLLLILLFLFLLGRPL